MRENGQMYLLDGRARGYVGKWKAEQGSPDELIIARTPLLRQGTLTVSSK